MREKLRGVIQEVIQKLGFPEVDFSVEHPENFAHGDYATNVAMVVAKHVGKKPQDVAGGIISALQEKDIYGVQKIDIAGPGFINIYLKSEFFAESVQEILDKDEKFGTSRKLEGKKVMVEYTDPNPFKEFHIGHLMSNAIGESISRLIEFSGADTIRACYQGDVGPHVAQAIWAMQKNNVAADSIESSMLGHMYVLGAKAYKENPESKKEIDEINKKVYRKDPTIKNLYNSGRKVSLDHFEEIYKVLGTTFTYYFFESEVAQQGVDIVKEFLQKGVFEKSEGAIVFQGENHGLHTRVFLTSQELPTYESKDLGLNKIKFEKEPDLFESIIITGNEQSEYFKVVLKAMSFIMSEVAAKTRHIAHGMMSGIGGKKMSSRTGDVVTGESLLKDVREMASEKIKNSDRDIDDPQELADQIAVGAIKYMILKQAPGNNISFDPEQALSFEGDSGPYLQYTYARTQSVLEKAKSEDVPSRPEAGPPSAENVADIKRLLYRFPEIVEDALENFAPHHVAGYLIDVARDFNSFYGDTKIVDREDTESPSRVALTKAVSIVLKNGLYLLGIEAPEKM